MDLSFVFLMRKLDLWVSGLVHWFKIPPWRGCRWGGDFAWWGNMVGEVLVALEPGGLAFFHADLQCWDNASMASWHTHMVWDHWQAGTEPAVLLDKAANWSTSLIVPGPQQTIDSWWLLSWHVQRAVLLYEKWPSNDHLERAWNYTTSLQWFP